METIKTIRTRKSVRMFKDGQLPEDVLNNILAAGCAAPVGMAQYDTLHLTVVQDAGVQKKISGAMAKLMGQDDDPLYNAQTLVVVSASENKMAPGIEYANAGCIIENMLLAATDCGVGSVYIWGAAVVLRGDEALRKELGIPAEFVPISCAALGYAAQPDDSEKELKVTIGMNRI